MHIWNELEFGAANVVEVTIIALGVIVSGDVFHGLELIRRSLEDNGFKEEAQEVAELQQRVSKW